MAWEQKKGDNFIFVYVSGGYVILGTRDTTIQSSSEYCSIEDFIIKGALQQTVAQEFGEKTFKEIYDKVARVHQQRNQKTSSPQAS
ncbi:hypothetical protein DICPUDRAFT_148591 [Dictyostelium purpureum]|uniref:Uncharacterized protein n=1 Tax=Dictyostelium purpureum TaxID=5786 RepID=F0ZBI4_DICPU|nr:uncharacterized protein DICPUDRAFT_148591 [Dictyostelium purpureum]EGC38701.1 hypothetical protein DICPUDRAFT_148591 [Dictyostelium purpureum]|eukprot:XP_003284797.1 hypothetical protein DICPUDRAFT_148591 [Dictyostelium purpureum]